MKFLSPGHRVNARHLVILIDIPVKNRVRIEQANKQEDDDGHAKHHYDLPDHYFAHAARVMGDEIETALPIGF